MPERNQPTPLSPDGQRLSGTPLLAKTASAPRKLTPLMREALQVAARQDGLRRVHDDRPGRPQWPAPAPTINALLRHGLVDHARVRNKHTFWVDVWRVTDAGLLALNPPVKPRNGTRILQRDIWRGGDYTTAPALSHPGLRSAGEAIDTGLLDPRHREEADARWRGDRAARDVARTLTGRLKAA